MSSTPAGWYPQADGRQRYWDGERWTEHFAPGTAAGTPASQQLTAAGAAARGDRPWFKKKRFVIPAGFAAFVVMVGALTGGGDTDPAEAGPTRAPSSTATPSAKTVVATPKPSATPAPVKAAPAPSTPPPAPAKPQLTTAQENAVRTAESYLEMSGFSQKGLIKQLEFEGYSVKDAQIALGTIPVNWNNEAAESAKAYTEMTGFSRSSLIKQLEFEGFTKKQAQFGATSVGL